MLKQLQERRENQDGFTLIELMVVVLIIAILIAIAVPTFLGARERAQDRAVQSNLRNALTAGKVIYADDGDYSGATAAELADTEPALTFQAAVSADANEVSFAVAADNQSIVYAALSDSGDCWYLRDAVGNTAGTSGTTFGVRAQGAAGGDCQGSNTTGVTFGAEW
ncbi:MAG: prepilin-type N-terminal cleavage/methylation domain-containing protein [Acidimicrobiales bacterium]|nr:prepilin-type N-terminal cleavage/methylation domain-containing protein [Acidimicrobiales bacterium]